MSNTAAERTEGESNPLSEHVEAGIYRNTSSGTYFERPKIHGKRTWRSLETKNLKHARETLHKRRAEANNGQTGRTEPQLTCVGEVILRYEKDGYLDSPLGFDEFSAGHKSGEFGFPAPMLMLAGIGFSFGNVHHESHYDLSPFDQVTTPSHEWS
jgi:hypothetical protein